MSAVSVCVMSSSVFPDWFGSPEEEPAESNPALQQSQPPLPLFESFALPVEFLPENDVHTVSREIWNDLELVQLTETYQQKEEDAIDFSLSPAEESNREKYIYGFLLENNASPRDINTVEHPFSRAKPLVEKWAAKFTSNPRFLEIMQGMILQWPALEIHEATTNDHSMLANEMLKVWKAVKEDHSFLVTHHFLDWPMLEFLNENPTFMEFICWYSLLTPLFALVMPLLLLIVPFFLLLVQGIEVTLETYISTILEIGESTFIGKTIAAITGELTPSKLSYTIFTVVLFLMQTYQNCVFCTRFIDAIQKMQGYLETIHEYTKSMNTYMGMVCDHIRRTIVAADSAASDEESTDFARVSAKKAFSSFVDTTEGHRTALQLFQEKCQEICSRAHTGAMGAFTFGNMGPLMSTMYHFYQNVQLAETMQYAFAFDGYIQQLHSIHQNVVAGFIRPASFPEVAVEPEEENGDSDTDTDTDTEKQCLKIIGQYYPPLVATASDAEEIVSNDLVLDKNMILTGPNASGKTTFLKTTLINVIFAQQTGFGFFTDCIFPQGKLYTHLHSYLNIPDTSSRDSLFQAETRRCKRILDSVRKSSSTAAATTEKHLCIMDEILTGTNPSDAVKTAKRFVSHLCAQEDRVDFLLTTHFVDLCDHFVGNDRIQLCRMGIQRARANSVVDEPGDESTERENEEDKEQEHDFVFTYKIENGISTVEGAHKILKDMNWNI